MLKLIDRQLIRSYFKAYLICFVSLVSLFIVIDLFTNIDDFTQKSESLLDALTHIFGFYSYKTSYIFDKLSEAIVLLGAMFTVAWMQRHNELLPLLSAGVCTQRVVRPVLFCACLMLGLTVVNKELIVPQIAPKLLNERSDPNGQNDLAQPWAYEPNGIHIEGKVASRRDQLVRCFCVTIPEHMGAGLVHLMAEEARYFPPDDCRKGKGGWLLTATQPPQLDNWNNADVLEMIDPGKYFLYTHDVNFEVLTRNSKWYLYTSTTQLYMEMCKPESKRLSTMAVEFHMRLTRPILGMVLVFLGLSIILRDQNRNIFIAAGLCLIMCAVVHGTMFGCKHFGDHGYLSPALAAWLPVLFYGPMAFVLFDAVHT